MFLFRFISFIILIGLFVLSIFWKEWGSQIFTVFGTLAGFGIVHEALTMLEKSGKKSYKFFTSLLSALIIFLLFFKISMSDLIFLPTIFVLILWLVLLFSKDREEAVSKLINSSAIILMLTVPLSFLVLIYMEGEGHNNEGRMALLFMVLVTKAGDTGAYVVGMLSNIILKNGNHKMVPSVSPKKSWEGFFGGLISSILLSFLMYKFMYNDDALFKPLFPGIILFFGGFIGDLTESAFKRTCGVKDSGAIIPGMGGFFDVLDSLIFNAPLFFLYTLFCT